MKTLIIYDTDGVVLSSASSTNELREPKGVPFLWLEVPYGQYVTAVDVSVTPHKVITESLPKSDTQIAQEQIDALTQAVAELSLLVGSGS